MTASSELPLLRSFRFKVTLTGSDSKEKGAWFTPNGAPRATVSSKEMFSS